LQGWLGGAAAAATTKAFLESHQRLSSPRRLQRLVEIGDNVVDVLDADR
jgi:hypothetical protein